MTSLLIKQLPNILTTLRLILAVPICFLIINENYSAVIWIAFIAGFSDALDGYLARTFNVVSYYGEVVDPLADKALLLCTYIAFSVVGLVSWWLVALLLLRDIMIVSGACIYHRKFAVYNMAPSLWGKGCTGAQIIFALMILTQQVYPVLPESSLQLALWSVILLTTLSGGHYLFIWRNKMFP
jgi:cardiolipin synthase